MTEAPPEKSLLFIVSGPAGSGKTTLCERMLEELSPRVQRVITATTRDPREGEQDGKDYYFLDKDTFEKRVSQGDFYEHAKVFDKRYGVLKEEVMDKLNQNIDLLLNIDVQGAETIRNASNDDPGLKGRVISIFIMPKDHKELRKRLEGRGQDKKEEIEKRLKIAEEEIKHWNKYDYCIPSGTKEEDFACLMSLYAAEKLRVR